MTFFKIGNTKLVIYTWVISSRSDYFICQDSGQLCCEVNS